MGGRRKRRDWTGEEEDEEAGLEVGDSSGSGWGERCGERVEGSLPLPVWCGRVCGGWGDV